MMKNTKYLLPGRLSDLKKRGGRSRPLRSTQYQILWTSGTSAGSGARTDHDASIPVNNFFIEVLHRGYFIEIQ